MKYLKRDCRVLSKTVFPKSPTNVDTDFDSALQCFMLKWITRILLSQLKGNATDLHINQNHMCHTILNSNIITLI